MSEFHVNVYKMRITELGKRSSSAIQFKSPTMDCIDKADDLFLNLQNKIEEVYWFSKGNWNASVNSIYLIDPVRDKAAGIFAGIADVGARGVIKRLRGSDGSIPYDIKNDDATMRDYFYYVEMPPESRLGFLVVERRGHASCCSAIQACIKRRFHQLNHTVHFEKVANEQAFEAYLHGHIKTVTAKYIPADKDARLTLKKTRVMRAKLSRDKHERFDIEVTVNRPITQRVEKMLRRWFKSGGTTPPAIVTLPVEDSPDKLVVTVLTPDGKTKALYPEMIEDIALSWDLTAQVSRGTNGEIDVASARAAVAQACDALRGALV